ncbi:hypothetical protein BgAZ_107520 [Babesia gibsoni]|uniref:Uncharacterized protein n=1 Tax=Babesia gibsoni TaxID=33632 RepID=A0AAD8PGB1_BABGI|nr:hypothetical protein BgAZ_107520 [Babesia gibsoni]
MEPHTLKDVIDFFGFLDTREELKTKYIGELDSRVAKYIDTKQVSGKPYKDHLKELFAAVTKVRKELLQDPNNFGKYSNFTEDMLHNVADTLGYWLPVLHSEFSFLYYLTSTEGKRIGGWRWSTDAFGPGNTETEVHKWLTDKSFDTSNDYNVTKGFTDADLKTGGKITPNLLGNLGLDYYGGGPLNHAQYGLFLLSSGCSHPSNVAASLIFVDEFCREVTQEDGMFKDKTICEASYHGCNTRDICKMISQNIEKLHSKLWPLYHPLDARTLATDENGAVEKTARHSIYKGKMIPEKFDEYMRLMGTSMTTLILYLTEMYCESVWWCEENMAKALSHGPSKYGYVFRDPWDYKTYTSFRNVANRLVDLSCQGSLNSLLECLDPETAKRNAQFMFDLKYALDLRIETQNAAKYRVNWELKRPVSTEKSEPEQTEEHARGNPEREATVEGVLHAASAGVLTNELSSSPEQSSDEADSKKVPETVSSVITGSPASPPRTPEASSQSPTPKTDKPAGSEAADQTPKTGNLTHTKGGGPRGSDARGPSNVVDKAEGHKSLFFPHTYLLPMTLCMLFSII